MTGHSLYRVDLTSVWQPCIHCGEMTLGEDVMGNPECIDCFMAGIEVLGDAKENR